MTCVFGGKVVGSNLTRIGAATVWRFLLGGLCCWSNLYLLGVKPSEGPPLWAEFETETSPLSYFFADSVHKTRILDFQWILGRVTVYSACSVVIDSLNQDH